MRSMIVLVHAVQEDELREPVDKKEAGDERHHGGVSVSALSR